MEEAAPAPLSDRFSSGDIAPVALDAVRFERLVQQARAARAAGDPDDAAAHLGRARALGRGPALADVIGEPFALPEIAGLTELRIAAAELEVEVELDAGRHQEVVGRLGLLLADQPLRERLWVLLMHALYRSGRQADALQPTRRPAGISPTSLGSSRVPSCAISNRPSCARILNC